MPAAIVPFNTADPLCTANQCLQQVVGSIDNNPVAQFSACVSLFGSPATITVTVPGDELSSTTTTTIPYTDIIVTLSTTESTYYETSTSYAEVLETDTAYSATSVATVTEVVTAPATVQTVVPKKRANKKRGCKPASPSLSSSASSTAAITTSTSAAPFPVASNCADLAEYSSACACISAVSTDVVVTVTIPGEPSVVTVTESSPVPSTSTSVVTVVVSSAVVVPATTTLASTTTELYQTTTTVTSIVAPVAPTQTSYLVIDSGARAGKYLRVVGQFLQWDYANNGVSAATQFALITDGGVPSLASDANMKMFVHTPTTTFGVLYFETNAQAVASGDKAVTCTLDGAVVSCAVPTLSGFDTLFSCGAYMYIGKATWSSPGCYASKFRMSS